MAVNAIHAQKGSGPNHLGPPPFLFSLYCCCAHRRGRIDHVRQYFYLRYTLLYKTLVVFFAVIYAQNAAQCTGQHPNSHFGDELTAKVKAKKDEREQHQDHHQCGAR